MQAEVMQLSTAPSGGWTFATIVTWEHRRGRPAHCLARAHRSAAGARPVVVLSEVGSNPEGRGISDDLPAVAAAFLRALPPEIEVRPEEPIWIAHHGDFSYPDALDAPEVFTLVPLHWTGGAYEEDLRQRRRLGREELHTVLGSMVLAPVPEVVEQFGR